MVRDWLPTLLQEQPLVYSSWIVGRRYGTQWTLVRGGVTRRTAAQRTYVFEFLLEIDLAALHKGRSPLRQQSRLEVDELLRPVSYRADTNGTRWRLDFAEKEVVVTLADNSITEVPRGRAEFAFDPNLPGQTALIVAELASSGRFEKSIVSLELFDVKQFAVVPYRLTTNEVGAGRRLLTTSHHEEIAMDRGVLTAYKLPKQSIEARLERSGAPLPQWRDQESLAGLTRTYRPPETRTFTLEDVTIAGPVTPIGGTLTEPAHAFCAALFLSGSGTHDRNGIVGELDLGTHEIMDHLAEQGILGLRVDTRGAGTTALGHDAMELGLDSLVADARACFLFLQNRVREMRLPIFLIGHSLGGVLSLITADEMAATAGVVLMAVPGRRIDELIADQLDAYGRRVGLDDNQIARQKHELNELVQVIEEDRPWESGKVPDYLVGAIRTRHFLQRQLRHPPIELIQALRCPVLICQGGKDFQVSKELDAPRLVEAARSAGLDCTYALFPNLDHLFKKMLADSTVETYFDTDRHVDGEFLGVVTDWLRSRAAVRG